MCGCGTEKAHWKERYFKYTKAVPFVINIMCFLINYGCSWLWKLAVIIVGFCPILSLKSVSCESGRNK